MSVVWIYREHEAGGPSPVALDTVAYSNLLGLVSVYRRDLTEPFRTQAVGTGGKVNHLWSDDTARALAGALDAALPDVEAKRDSGGEYVLRDRLYDYWHARLALLNEVAAFARGGAFAASLDV